MELSSLTVIVTTQRQGRMIIYSILDLQHPTVNHTTTTQQVPTISRDADHRALNPILKHLSKQKLHLLYIQSTIYSFRTYISIQSPHISTHHRHVTTPSPHISILSTSSPQISTHLHTFLHLYTQHPSPHISIPFPRIAIILHHLHHHHISIHLHVYTHIHLLHTSPNISIYISAISPGPSFQHKLEFARNLPARKEFTRKSAKSTSCWDWARKLKPYSCRGRGWE